VPEIALSLEEEWFAEDCPVPALLPHQVTALDIARWYAHGLASFGATLSYCDTLRTYLPVWRLPVPERWCFVPRSVEDGAMLCYRSAIREALERGHGSAGAHEIAAVLEQWAAAPPFRHPRLDGVYARLLVDRTLELRVQTAERATAAFEPETGARHQYRVIGRLPRQRRLPPSPPSDCWVREPEWEPFAWDGSDADLIGAYLRHEGAVPTLR